MEKNMNTRTLLVPVLIRVFVALSAGAPAATPAPTAVPPTTVPPTAVPTTAPAQALTAFSPKTFSLPITFGYGSDWKIEAEDSNSSEVVLKYKNYDGEFLFINPKSATVAGPAAPYSGIPFPDDFVNWIQTHGLFQVVKTQPVVVGGLPGTQIDADATAACGAKTEWFLVGSGGWNCGEGGHYRFTFLDDVNGEQLLIMTVGYVSAQDFVLMTDGSHKVLGSVVFTK